MRTGTALSYLLSNHLGSSSVTTDADGNLVSKGALTLDYLDSSHVHAVTNAGSPSSVNSYQYDQNGNQTTRHIGSDTFTLLYACPELPR